MVGQRHVPDERQQPPFVAGPLAVGSLVAGSLVAGSLVAGLLRIFAV